MTFSICVRESLSENEGGPFRFAVGVTTANPTIGVFTPFVSEDGAVATQALTQGDLGPRALDELANGRSVDDLLPDILADAGNADTLQIHALDADSSFVHHGEAVTDPTDDGYDWDCVSHRSGEHYSVAGNFLVREEVVDAVAETYEEADQSRLLAERLLDALEAGDEAGGDKRKSEASSAAIKVVDPDAPLAHEWYDDLRVDASPTPLADLRETYERGKRYHEEVSEEW
ncbi:Uncharacterized conserved protein, Ntn-hydrolase superfamily [Halomicrobium zhouii]|uniref:Uncharacterized conserved protein, Ntn-hydrolase superfamily n=1 Tax=Halomicrobium zhouii TaxID=767519 RepID=A0A1I6K1H0_9EURY|nr:DUF1028 domain-containing protein [Halomicrobium zhouii]SFR85024.1 Uncharacterized conserved protein, Ntn-hydrolase superfamily [Halomicrobium zhouii]